MRTMFVVLLSVLLTAQAVTAPTELASVVLDTRVQVVMNPPQCCYKYPITATDKITLIVTGLTTTGNSIMLADSTLSTGQVLPTAKVDYQTLSAQFPMNSPQGIYRMWVHTGNGDSNSWDVVVGTGAKTKICDGGILPVNATVDEVNTYMANYDTLNCKFMSPPVPALPN